MRLLEHDNPCSVHRVPASVVLHTHMFRPFVFAIPSFRAAPYCVGASLFLIRPDAPAVGISLIITYFGSTVVPYCTCPSRAIVTYTSDCPHLLLSLCSPKHVLRVSAMFIVCPHTVAYIHL